MSAFTRHLSQDITSASISIDNKRTQSFKQLIEFS
jgi:hypothetical protein